LCELATVEEDPFLRAALWEEYNQYRRLVARQ
jgi:protein-S-isoprenylcysteine O-methyltransferase Ste14